MRFAAMGVGCALFFALSMASAADSPHAVKPPKGAANKPGSHAIRAARLADSVARRGIAAGPTADDAGIGAETPELRTLREAERELFPPAAAAPGGVWPSELPFTQRREGDPQGTRVDASGVPSGAPAPSSTDASGDLSWLTGLQMPDLPIRWDERVVRYLQFFRDDPRGRSTFANLMRHWGRVREMMREALRKRSLPEDLVWVAMVESGFDPAARSPSGAAGLWQFMPETARVYGLAIDRWVDERYNVDVATAAAADMLGDLHRRFGSWELALAAYNMGYAGLSSVVRRYNTNDYWSLARAEGAIPWQTTLYVPKILAASVVAHNLTYFGFSDLVVELPVETEAVDVPSGTALALVAQVAGCGTKEIEILNPQLRAGRTPPAADGDATYPVQLPLAKARGVARALAKVQKGAPSLERYVVRFGETIDQIALARKTTTQKLVDLNTIGAGEAVRGGTVLLVPSAETGVTAASAASTGPAASRRTVVVPAERYAYPGQRRVFYRVTVGDTLKDIATVLHVGVDDLRRWNDLDPSARLEDGMTLQAFVDVRADLSRVLVTPERDVQVVTAGSDEFFALMEQTQGFKRLAVTVKAGDSLESIGKRFGVGVRTMERINRRGRSEALKLGETVIVYVPGSPATPTSGGATASNGAAPNGPLPEPPVPDLMP